MKIRTVAIVQAAQGEHLLWGTESTLSGCCALPAFAIDYSSRPGLPIVFDFLPQTVISFHTIQVAPEFNV